MTHTIYSVENHQHFYCETPPLTHKFHKKHEQQYKVTSIIELMELEFFTTSRLRRTPPKQGSGGEFSYPLATAYALTNTCPSFRKEQVSRIDGGVRFAL